jgi:hypothetical protein
MSNEAIIIIIYSRTGLLALLIADFGHILVLTLLRGVIGGHSRLCASLWSVVHMITAYAAALCILVGRGNCCRHVTILK